MLIRKERVRLVAGAVILVAGALAGCHGAVPGIDEPDALVLLSIEPHPQPAAEGAKAEETFHGNRILKKRIVTDAKERAEIVSAVQSSFREGGSQAKCFNPHHGLIVTKGQTKRELVICFDCHNAEVDGEDQMRSISESARPVLDAALAK